MFSFLFSSLTGPGIYPQVVERILQNASGVSTLDLLLFRPDRREDCSLSIAGLWHFHQQLLMKYWDGKRAPKHEIFNTDLYLLSVEEEYLQQTSGRSA